MNILSTHDLTKTYGTGDNVVHALTDVSLDIEEGKFVSIIGSSGSGKSTLLNLLGGLDRPTSGDVILDGKAIFEMDDEALTVFRRRKIGFVFQNYNLVPILNVYENIVLPIELDGTKIDTAYVDKIMDVLGLSEKKFSMPNQLSGGQQQRVAIAHNGNVVVFKETAVRDGQVCNKYRIVPPGSVICQTIQIIVQNHAIVQIRRPVEIRFDQDAVRIAHQYRDAAGTACHIFVTEGYTDNRCLCACGGSPKREYTKAQSD